jgi:ketosteroid isomerase-like protein
MMTRYVLLVLALVAVSAIPASAQLKSAAQQQAEAEAATAEGNHQELINLEKETVHALMLNNTTFFKRVYGEDFVGTTATGRVINKAAYMANVASSTNKYSVFIASDIQVRIFQDTAVVSSLWTARGTQDGRPFDRQYRVTHVYIYGQRGWQAVSSQETLLAG